MGHVTRQTKDVHVVKVPLRQHELNEKLLEAPHTAKD